MLERIDYELGVIKTMGFSAYFLVVWDLYRLRARAASESGPGEGARPARVSPTACASPNVDPIKYDLLFERMLNPGRKQMPDIDMDFDSRYRGEMIRYAAERYGWDHVAQVITFSTIKARAAVRDSARVLGYPYAVGDKIAKLMPPLVMGRDTPLRACLEEVDGYADGYKMASELRVLYEADPDAKRVIDVARGLEGLRRQDGIHAAAVVITREPLTEYLPIQRKPEAGGNVDDAPDRHAVRDARRRRRSGSSRWTSSACATSTCSRSRSTSIERSTGERFDIDNVALDDAKTFEMLRRGDTVGVFQLEGGPVRSLLRSLGPTRFEDIAALVALYRPGPMGTNMHTDYADRKNGRKPVTYYHADVEEVLAPTYGLMIYQEQLMQVAQRLAGYSLERGRQPPQGRGEEAARPHGAGALEVRRGLRRAGPHRRVRDAHLRHHRAVRRLLVPQGPRHRLRPHRVPDRVPQGELPGRVPRRVAHERQDQQGPDRGLPQRVPAARHRGARARRQRVGIRLLRAPTRRRPEGTAIRFGMSAVRNVGEGVVAQIVAARTKGGPFVDFYDFCDRVDPSVLNKRTIESLVKAGGFDSLGHPRQGLVHVFETIVDTVIDRRRNEAEGQFDLFSAVGEVDDRSGGGAPCRDPRHRVPEVAAPRVREGDARALRERAPVDGRRARRCAGTSTPRSSELREAREGELRTVGGIVTSLARKYTRRGDLMGTFVLEDLAGVLEVMVFPKTMADFGHVLEDDAIVVVKGRVDLRDDTPKLVAMEIIRPEIVIDGGPPGADQGEAAHAHRRQGRRASRRSSPSTPVTARCSCTSRAPEKTTVLRLGDDLLVDAGNGLFAELRVLLGADCIA